jgi:hypothetical protein
VNLILVTTQQGQKRLLEVLGMLTFAIVVDDERRGVLQAVCDNLNVLCLLRPCIPEIPIAMFRKVSLDCFLN